MILQALTRYYEKLSEKNEIPKDGWADMSVAWALNIDSKGNVLSVLPLSEQIEQKKKIINIPRVMSLPAPFNRKSNIRPNFIYDNSAYILGISTNKKEKDENKDKSRVLECYEASKEFHINVLKPINTIAAQSVCSFFEHWEPDKASSNPIIGPLVKDLSSGSNITFYTETGFASEDPEISIAWQNIYQEDSSGNTSTDLVTGKQTYPCKIHPAIKGVIGAQPSGAALISFNADAFVSYGKEQNLNAPIGKYAAFAYTTVLNHLISDSEHRKIIGDSTVIYWAEDAEKKYQDCACLLLDDLNNTISDKDLDNILRKLASGQSAVFDDFPLNPDNRFYILALSPNNARISVRLFCDTNFRDIAKKFTTFYDEFKITGSKDHLPLWMILNETARKGSDGKTDPSPQLSGDMLRAVLTGSNYPETFYQMIRLRINAERDIRPIKAASIKAFLLRNRQNHPCYQKYKEALGVKLNEETNYLPYVLGELFAVLEAIQEKASNVTTIKDRFFTSACTTPQLVFPRLIELANHHLRKLKENDKDEWSKELGILMSKIEESFPALLNLDEQGIFQIGYYHKRKKIELKNNHM